MKEGVARGPKTGHRPAMLWPVPKQASRDGKEGPEFKIPALMPTLLSRSCVFLILPVPALLVSGRVTGPGIPYAEARQL